ncbi:helix-turn-helix domain-containing protein [Actinomadura graeca]|uniref:Helix-turn-helix domain-containing protein n=1 Tax=Actinomadura graeca TaxID=2750812 RepID=A0ABX8R4B6_9ACTN|nr:helix-turn-helix transcriptional regulator [Actinomadura graeca]QXJ25880.1 helix-turn-helix domain-containing protein [Actinomadura graeca]
MAARDALWSSRRARAIIKARDVGGAIRLARQERGWRLSDLGEECGYSASTISRMETGRRAGTDLDMLRRVATAAGVPLDLLGELVGITTAPPVTVAPTVSRPAETDDAMRRRTLMTAGLAVPLTLLTGLDDALAILPEPKTPPSQAQLTARLARARRQFDTGSLTRLIAELPDLLASANHAAESSRAPEAFALLAGCYDVATETLNKIGSYPASRITADRATTAAALSGSPIAMAASARCLGIVLRHEDRRALADRVTLTAADRLDATGLTTQAQAAAYAQMLATCAYNAAQAGDRARALELIADAGKAAARLPDHPVAGQPFTITPAQVTLYKVGVHWSLGDAGTAIDAGTDLHPSQFPTPERRGRLHTDMARAWWQWGRPDQAAHALLAAYHQAPGEVTARPSIRQIAVDLVQCHPRADGAHRLAAILRNTR